MKFPLTEAWLEAWDAQQRAFERGNELLEEARAARRQLRARQASFDLSVCREVTKHTGGWVRWSTLRMCIALARWGQAIRQRKEKA